MTGNDQTAVDVAAHDRAARQILAEMLGRVANGDWAAFEEVYRLSSAKLLQVCHSLLSDRADAEDALQETYASVWARAAGFDQARGTAMTWLITIARNHAVDRLRIRKRAVSASISEALPLSDDRLSALDMLVQREVQQRLAIALDLIDDRNRWLVDAIFFGGHSYTHLSAQLGVPIETVKSRVRRALIKAKTSIEHSTMPSAE